MRARKIFCVIAYDIASDYRRSQVVKLLETAGTRINLSVFECMLTDAQFLRLQHNILKQIDLKKDTVVYYPMCINCFTKIIYQPSRGNSSPDTIVTI